MEPPPFFLVEGRLPGGGETLLPNLGLGGEGMLWNEGTKASVPDQEMAMSSLSHMHLLSTCSIPSLIGTEDTVESNRAPQSSFHIEIQTLKNCMGQEGESETRALC